MGTAKQKALVGLVASTAIVVAPKSLVAQSMGSRPASIALTVVVPAHLPSDDAITSGGSAAITHATPTSVDLETMVALANRKATRVEVRLGSTWRAEPTSLWVKDQHGELTQVARERSVVAFDAPDGRAVIEAPLHFHVESSSPLVVTSLAVPLEYRLTVGRGDEFSVWTFASVLRLDRTRAGSASTNMVGDR